MLTNVSERSSSWLRRVWIDHRCEVACDAQELYALLQDIPGWPSWTPGLSSVRPSGEGALEVGSRFTMVLGTRSWRKLALPCRVLAMQPDRIEWGGGAFGAVIRHRFELQAIDSQRTQLRHFEYATGFLAIVNRPFERMIYAHDRLWSDTIVEHFARAKAA